MDTHQPRPATPQPPQGGRGGGGGGGGGFSAIVTVFLSFIAIFAMIPNMFLDQRLLGNFLQQLSRNVSEEEKSTA
ncbi:hypothetical protein CFP56_004016 [Quercus suber]|uniref:Uncharacterized protein n=1 Tax=Quercus suber TaxID=58331 RepID=A0AAW0LDS7_QUESU